MGGEISLHIGGLWHWAYDILNQSYQGGKLACFTARTTRQALGCIVIPSKHPSIRSLWHSIRQITNICYPFMSGGSLILTLSTIYWVIITIFYHSYRPHPPSSSHTYGWPLYIHPGERILPHRPASPSTKICSTTPRAASHKGSARPSPAGKSCQTSKPWGAVGKAAPTGVPWASWFETRLTRVCTNGK